MAGALFVGTSYLALGTTPFSFVADGSGDGGTITINVHRTMFQVSPDSVRFTVDLDSSSFDTQGPQGDEIYDARLHDLIFLWDFDDAATGDWTAPVNVLPHWKNRNVGKGPFVAHMYTSPGTYNPSVLVIEPSSGKVATASVEVVVADPDTVYGGSGVTYPDTICINPVVDSDFSLKPTGAYEMNFDTVLASDSAILAIRNETPKRKKRFLFKRGASYIVDFNFDLYEAGIYFGDYGDPQEPDPILNGIEETPVNKVFFCSGNYAFDQGVGEAAPDVRFSNLDMRGTLDPTAALLDQNAIDYDACGGMSFTRGLDLMVSACSFTGLIFGIAHSPFGGKTSTFIAHQHLDDSILTDFGGQYPLFNNHMNVADSSIAFTGCRLAQRPDAIDTNEAGETIHGTNQVGTRAIFRSEFAWLTYMAGLDCYHTDSSQSHLKLIEGAHHDGAIVNVHSVSTEGGSHGINIAGTLNTGFNRSPVANVVIDEHIHVGHWCGECGINSRATGVTYRNSLVIYPDVPRRKGNEVFAMVRCNRWQDVATDDNVDLAPLNIYNNTFVCGRTQAENWGNLVLGMVWNQGDFIVNESNNIIHLPQMGSTAFAPLLDDGTPLWTPRNIGRRSPGDFTLQVTLNTTNDLVTPTTAVQKYSPKPTSTALGTAAVSGAGDKTAHFHIESTGEISGGALVNASDVRPSGNKDKGAWQVST